MAKNLTTGLQRGLRQSIAGGLGTGDLFSIASLDLQFARHKSLDSRVTHTRQSSATYVDGDGVIRTAVTNLLLNSEDITGSGWSTYYNTNGTASAPIITANYGIAPDGTQTADRVQLDKGSGTTSNDNTNIQNNSYNTIVGLPYTQSIYLKTVDGSSKDLRFSFNGSAPVTITVTGDWQRFSHTANATDTQRRLRLALRAPFGTSDSADLLVWGAQAEQSSTVGQYVKTTSTINSAPRFDHNPTTGESLGLLVEESRTNSIATSNVFSTAAATQTVDADVAPDGTTTAVEIVSAGGGAFKASIPVTNGSTVTYSVFLKAVSGSNILTSVGFERFGATGINGSVKVNLNDATLSNIGSDVVSSSIKEYGNGWYRVSVTATAVDSTTNIINYSNAGPCTYLIWGMQMETGSFPTSYIPTSGSTVTRAADVASITGTNFSSWYEPDNGTVFSEANFTNTTSYNTVFNITDGTSAERVRTIQWNDGTSNRILSYMSNNTNQANFVGVSVVGKTKNVGAYKTNDFAGVQDGGSVQTDSTGAVSTLVNSMELGQTQGAFLLNGHISRLTYWPTRLSNNTLQTITR